MARKKTGVLALNPKATAAPAFTRLGVLQLWGALQEIQEIPGPFEFVYALARTLSYLRGEVEASQKTIQAMEKQRLGLINEYGLKDDQGALLIVDGQVTLDPKRKTEFQEKVDPLMKSQEAFLNETVQVKLHQVELASFPQEGINSRQMEALLPLILEG